MSNPVPNGWERVVVGELIERQFSGPSPTCEERNTQSEKEWGVLKTTAVTWSGFNEFAHKTLPQEYWGLKNLEIKPGDVLVTKAGPRHRVGVVVYVPSTQPRLIVSGKMIALRLKPEIEESAVVAGLLSQREAQKYLDDRTTGMAESQLNFTNTALLNTPLVLPPKDERVVISKINESLDTQIRQTEAIIAKLQQVKQGLLNDLLTRGIDANGQLRPPRDQAPELYKESPLGWIPREWEVDSLDALTSKIVDGVHHTPAYVKHGVPFVTIRNLTASDSIDFSNLKYVDEKTHRACRLRADPTSGDVLVTKDGTLGVARIVEEGMPEFSIFVSVALLRPVEKLSSLWLHLFFDSGNYLKQLAYLSSGTGLKHIHLEQFRQFLIEIPSKEEQTLINQRLDAFRCRLLDEKKLLNKLKIQKSGLMDDLLTGRVRVTSLLDTAKAS